MKEITSIQNSFVKNVIKLQEKARERKKQQLFVIEGKREITLAINGNYTIENILFCEEIITEKEVRIIFNDDDKLIKI